MAAAPQIREVRVRSVRVPMEQERDGLDVSLHGEVAYDLPAPSVATAEEADTVEIKS